MTGSRHAVPAEASPEQERKTLSMLSEHIPISLIMDLSSPVGPDSEGLLRSEGETSHDWLPPRKTAAPPGN